MVSDGGYGPFVFVQDLPDIDWSSQGGYGVQLDMSAMPTSLSGLVDIFEKLVEAGWAGSGGRWTIQQQVRNWHGAGANSLVRALMSRESRYSGLAQIHGTEVLCYQDAHADERGFYTLTAQIDAHAAESVWWCEVSLQLYGVPLDPAGVENLASVLGVDAGLYFRPRGTRSVERRHFSLDEVPLEPKGFVLADDGPRDASHSGWACGLIVDNPFAVTNGGSPNGRPEWLPANLGESQLLICALRDWHPVDQGVRHYQLQRCEWAWGAEVLVFRPVVHWTEPRRVAP